MREINLRDGVSTMVDNVDYDLLAMYVWYLVVEESGYRYCCGYNPSTKKNIRMSRLILGVSDTSLVVDHIDGNPLNNQRSNLRVCTIAQNNRNRRAILTSSSSGVKGVSFEKKRGKWKASISINGASKTLGRFSKITDAAKAYNDAATFYFNDFAKLNDI